MAIFHQLSGVTRQPSVIPRSASLSLLRVLVVKRTKFYIQSVEDRLSDVLQSMAEWILRCVVNACFSCPEGRLWPPVLAPLLQPSHRICQRQVQVIMWMRVEEWAFARFETDLQNSNVLVFVPKPMVRLKACGYGFVGVLWTGVRGRTRTFRSLARDLWFYQ